MSEGLKMTVNVSLCGSIPRSQMNFCSTKHLDEIDASSNRRNHLRKGIGSKNTKSPCSKSTNMKNSVNNVRLPRQVSCEEMNTSTVIAPSPPPIIEPPSWAVAAKGDSRLEPVLGSSNVQTAIDLTKQAVFRVGRSQNSDLQLLHCTSSRRHAILFHHPNGSCYIVDCGSAHGTFVNGVRINTAMESNLDNGSTGIILPHRVKKGSLLRFGGPGAPCFILKSFSVVLETLVKNLKETNQTSICNRGLHLDTTPEICSSECNDSDMSSEALIALNTRLNAIGNSSHLSTRDLSSSLSSAQIYSRLQPQTQTSITYLKKRLVSFDDSDVEAEMPPVKRLKSSFMAQSELEYPSSDAAIVSPSRQQKPTLQFNFESVNRPVVSPTPLEEVNSLMKISTNVSIGKKKSILRTPLSLPSTMRRKRRVNFGDSPPEVFHL